MTGTLLTTFSESEIKRQASTSNVRDLRDARFPGVYFRFGRSRERGSWYLVTGSKWNRIAGYPELPVKNLINALPAIRERLAINPDAPPTADTLHTVGQLLDWFAGRHSRDRSLSAKRKGTATSVINCHLKPRLNDLALADVSRSSLDKLLMWPAQADVSLAYVRLMWGVLVVAFRQAAKLKLISSNPIAGFKFTDFTTARVVPKAARLRGVQLPEVLAQLQQAFDQSPTDCTLALLMLCHGTRVGETRQARWAHLTKGEQAEWFIPAENTKTRCEHRLPLTTQALALIERYRAWQLSKGYQGAFLFPAKNGRPMTESQACAVFTRLGQGEWTSHDLRKVARTGWTDLGVDYLIGEMLVNHTLTRNVQTYIHTSAEQLKRDALEKWHGWLDSNGFSAIHGSTEAGIAVSHNGPEATAGGACEAALKSVKSEVSKA